MIQITLPYPDRALSPNARVHWAVKAKAAKAYREVAYYAALEAGVPRQVPADTVITYRLLARPRTRRTRDDDNLIASTKNARDSIAEAMGVNDCRFRCTGVEWQTGSGTVVFEFDV